MQGARATGRCSVGRYSAGPEESQAAFFARIMNLAGSISHFPVCKEGHAGQMFLPTPSADIAQLKAERLVTENKFLQIFLGIKRH